MAATVAVRSLVLLRPGRRVNIVTHGVTTVGDDDASRLPRVFFVHGSCANLGQFDNQHEWCEATGLSYVAYDALGCGEVRPCTNVEFVFCKSAVSLEGVLSHPALCVSRVKSRTLGMRTTRRRCTWTWSSSSVASTGAPTCWSLTPLARAWRLG